jgi:hypothetical protein
MLEVTLPAAERLEGVMIGRLTGFSTDGRPLVSMPERVGSRLARATVALTDADLGRELALLFEDGDPERPLIIGRVLAAAPAVEVVRDGQRLELEAEREIVLRCGKASITLTRAGKVLLRGTYVLSRSSGVNKIKGGSVQLN